MPEFFDWQPSERYGELRNDGRSIHHRNELEKVLVAIAGKLIELKAEIGGIEYIDVTEQDVLDDSWLGYEDGYIDETGGS